MPRTSKTILAIALLTLGVAGGGLYAFEDELRTYARRVMSGEASRFAEMAPPLPELHHVFDLGVVDADGDGRLDLFSSNHNYRQVLMLANDEGTYADVLTSWGLDQNRDFPGWEQSFQAPPFNQPGLYIYWLGETLVLRAHGLGDETPVNGTLGMFSKIGVVANEGFLLDQRTLTVPDSPIAETVISFAAKGDARLHLAPLSRGVQTRFELAPTFPASKVHVGNQNASPSGPVFSPFLRDRHALAWADINGDGQLDIYISRGGVGGMIRMLPAALRERISDELLLTGGTPRFHDATAERGIEKKDCSGRHAEWVDFDGDGRLDLFVNCQDRGKSPGIFPKQLWHQDTNGGFRDVAIDVGLGLPKHELIDFVWMDAEGDGDLDLLTSEDKGFFLYRNQAGEFTTQFLFRPDFVRADVEGLKGEVNNYWRFDGKLTVADFDADGDLDVFSSSKRGNVLLLNEAGNMRRVDPASLGLPSRSLNATWVDYDNDGRPDLHVVPDGLYRQTPHGRFDATGLLALTPNRYQAAIIHWYDRDSDGKRDVLLALNENPSQWRWWQRPFRNRDDAFRWTLHAWRNMTQGGNWLQIELAGPAGNRQAIGARVTVTTADGAQVQEVGGNDSSFFSQGHYRLYFGLGTHSRANRVTVRWRDGQTREYGNVAANRLMRIDPDHSPD